MGVVNTIASAVADETRAVPWDVSGPASKGIFVTTGHCAVAAADSDTSTYRLCRLPSNARVVAIKLFSTAITGGTSYDLGLYDSGSTVKAVHAYATALDLSTAVAGVDQAFVNRALTLDRQQVWADAGDGSDGGTYYDLVATANTVGSGNGTIMAIVSYVI